MTITLPPDIDDMVRQYLSPHEFANEVDVLREAPRALGRQRAVFDDFRHGLAEVEAGAYRPLAEVDREIRSKYAIPKSA